MRPQRIRFLLTFLAGVMAAAVTGVLASSAGSLAATRYEELSVFTSVLNLVRRNYVEPVEEDELVRGALRGMLAELDPHSSFHGRGCLQGDAGRHQGRVPRPRHRDQQAQGRLRRGGLADRGHARGEGRHQVARPDHVDLPHRGARGLDRAVPFEQEHDALRGREPDARQEGLEDHDRDLPRGLRSAQAVRDHPRRGEGGFGLRPDVGAALRLRSPARLPGAHRRRPRGDARHASPRIRRALPGARARHAGQPGRPARPGGEGRGQLAQGRTRRLHQGARREPAPGVPRPSGRHGAQLPDRGARERGHRERVRDRRRRAAGPRARAGDRRQDLRQGFRADGLSAGGRRGAAPHDRPVLHTGRSLDPGGGHHPRHPGAGGGGGRSRGEHAVANPRARSRGSLHPEGRQAAGRGAGARASPSR